ncbi:hypothetical protein EJB05_44529, partial [Eragrostis curvula]
MVTRAAAAHTHCDTRSARLLQVPGHPTTSFISLPPQIKAWSKSNREENPCLPGSVLRQNILWLLFGCNVACADQWVRHRPDQIHHFICHYCCLCWRLAWQFIWRETSTTPRHATSLMQSIRPFSHPSVYDMVIHSCIGCFFILAADFILADAAVNDHAMNARMTNSLCGNASQKCTSLSNRIVTPAEADADAHTRNANIWNENRTTKKSPMLKPNLK